MPSHRTGEVNTWSIPRRLDGFFDRVCRTGLFATHKIANYLPTFVPDRKVHRPIMVCAKCQKQSKGTTLVTPGVKKKSEMYFGSPASSSAAAAGGNKKSATLGQTGVSKSKLLSKAAKNPYAMYSRYVSFSSAHDGVL